MPRRTMSAKDKAQILDLARTGLSRAKIAKQVGWSLNTVATLCRKEGLPSNVTLPVAFVEARALSIKERQVQARERKLALDELYDARVMANLKDGVPWTTRRKTQGGGEEFVEVPIIPADDYRNATSAAASNASAFKAYAPLETGGDTAAADSVVDKLMAGFINAAQKATKPAPVGDEEAAPQ